MLSKFSNIIFVLILLLILSSVDKSRASFGGNIANKYFLEKEKFILEILHRVEDPLMNREWLGIGRSLVLNESNYLNFLPEMHEFYATYRNGRLLPADHIFNPTKHIQYRQALGLFYFFYQTNDWETLRTNACWARVHVNSGMFIFAFTQALLKRIDLRGLVLPKIYEIVPKFFLPESDIRTAEKFDYSQWNRLETLYGKPLQTLQSNWKEVRRPRYIKNLRGTPNWAQAMEDVMAFWYPIQSKQDSGLTTYFTEDPDWNAYWYYQNMGLWWSDIDNLNADFLLWETWFGNLQQILARYKIESYAIDYWKPKSSYRPAYTVPKLLHLQGIKFHIASDTQNLEILRALSMLISQVDQATSEQRFPLVNGAMQSLIHGRNWSELLNTLFGQNLYKFFEKFFGLTIEYENSPYLLQYFETQLRDARFYYYAEILLNIYHRLRRSFQNYEISELKQPKIKITDVSVGQLETFFEAVDFDVSNLLSNKHYYFDGQLLWGKSLHARQQRLQHKPYTIQFNITSPMQQAIILRMFLAPATAPLTPNNYFQLDSFVVNLIAGSNIIKRSSEEFFGSQSTNHISYTELYRYTLLALDDRYEFPLNITNSNCAFPQRLLLPRGGLYGQALPIKFFFIATSYSYRFRQALNLNCDFSNGIMRFDELPVNFPFDYEHDEVGAYIGDNIYWKRAEIYHLD